MKEAFFVSALTKWLKWEKGITQLFYDSWVVFLRWHAKRHGLKGN